MLGSSESRPTVTCGVLQALRRSQVRSHCLARTGIDCITAGDATSEPPGGAERLSRVEPVENLGPWCNGSTPGFGPGSSGSNPDGPAFFEIYDRELERVT